MNGSRQSFGIALVVAMLVNCTLCTCADAAALTLGAWRRLAAETRMLAENDIPAAYAQAERLRSTIPAESTPADRARLLNLLARIDIYRGDTASAAAYAEQAFALAKANGDLVGQAESDLNVALNAVNQGRIDKMTTAVTHAMTILDGVDRPDLIGEAMLRTSMMYRRLEQFDDSVTVNMQALETARRDGHPLALTYAYQGMAMSYDISGRSSEAKDYYTKMLLSARKAGSGLLEADAKQGLSGIMLRQGDVAAAESTMREAMAQYRAIGGPLYISRSLISLADVLRKKGKIGEAVSQLDEAARVYEQYQVKIGLWWVLNTRSADLRSLGNIAAADADAERAYVLAQDIGFPLYLSESARRLAEISAVRGDHKRAYQLSVEATEMSAKVAREKASQRILDVARRYESESKQRQIDALNRLNERQSAALRQSELKRQWTVTLATASLLFLSGTMYFLVRTRRSNRLLQQAQNSQRAILDAIPDTLFELDLEGRYHDVHALHPEKLTASAESLLGKTVYEMLPPEGARMCLQALREAAVTGSSFGRQFSLPLPQGDAWFELSVSRKSMGEGEAPRFIMLAHDITERKRFEQALGESELQYRTLAEHTPDTIARYDAQCRRIYANPRMVMELGVPLDRLLGSTPTEIPGEDTSSSYEEHIRNVFATGAPEEFEYVSKTADGARRVSFIRLTPELGAQNEVVSVLAVGRDISEIDQYRQSIHRMAFFDALTGLPNRVLLLDRFRQAIAEASWHGHKVGLMLLDLDRFKEINDTLGHGIGDIVLREAAERLLGCIRIYDTVARLGGDEFAALLPDMHSSKDLATIALKIIDAFAQPFIVDNRELFLSASMGIAIYPDDSIEVDTLFRYADSAMYHAKQQGRNNFQFYSSELTEKATGRMAVESALRRAQAYDEFELYYQPQVDLKTCRIVGAEALLRWNSPEHGVVTPDRFITIAEETGLIVGIGEWVLESACRRAVAWNLGRAQPLRIAVNLSTRQFIRNDLVDTIAGILHETGCEAGWIKLEITESLLLEDNKEIASMLDALHTMGLSISIDDFGTGYSALSYLNRFPVSQIKIDRSFVQDIPDDHEKTELVKAMISISHALNLDLVAEGVETREQADCLQAKGCRTVQGYLFGKPMPYEDLERMIQVQSESNAR